MRSTTIDAVIEQWKSTRFSPAEEEEYRDFKAKSVLYVRRFSLAMGCVFWISFLYWDFQYHQHFDVFYGLVGIRLAGEAYLLALTACSFTSRFEREETAQKFLVSGLVVCWVALLVMMMLSPPPNNFLDYYTGLSLILFFVYTVLWLSPKAATVASVLLMVGFIVTQWAIGFHIPDAPGLAKSYRAEYEYYSFVAGYYLFSFGFIGTLVCFQLDIGLRNQFLQRKSLMVERDKISTLNAELRSRVETVQTMHDRLTVESTQRQQQAAALIEFKEDQRRLATEANQRKSRFLAAATHDIRQPLTALDAIVEVLGSTIAGGNLRGAQEHMTTAQLTSRALRRTVNAVLEISRLDSGVVVPNYTTIDPRPFVESIYRQYEATAAGTGVDLRLHHARDDRGRAKQLLRSDQDLLHRVISNLVANAIKYTPAGGGVLLGYTKFQARIRIDVYDTGIGIPKDKMKLVFEPFFQMNNAARDRENGLGLGLSIVAQIVTLLEQHRLDFASNEGRGSRFSVEVPTVDLAIGVQEQEAADQIAADDLDLSGLYILLVDDDELIRRTVRPMLESWGALVESCSGLVDVSEFAGRAERIPDVVLTDYRLSNSHTASDVLKIVRKEFRRDIPAIIMSGDMNTVPEMRILAKHVLAKPVVPEQLRSLLAAMLPSAEHP